MPDEPENPKNLPGRHRPRLSELSKETTEGDLWDLEDEDQPTSGRSPAEPISESPKSESAAKKKAPELEKIPTEPRAKPRSAAARKKAKPAPVESNDDPASPKARTPRSIDPGTRPPAPKASRPNGPRPLDPVSSDPPPAEAKTAPKKPEPERAEAETQAPEKARSAPPQEKSSLLGKEPSGEETKSGKGEKKEKVGLIAFGVVILALLVWWLSSLFSSISTTRLGDDQPDLPAEGTLVTIDSAESYWREPVREGDQPDIAKREVEFIPVLNVTLEDGNSGVIRVIFRNEQGDFVGDSISQAFANGVFDSNASPTIEFPATDGFTNSGEFNGYRVGDNRWTIDVFEGPSADAPGSEFKLLFKIPVSSNRQ